MRPRASPRRRCQLVPGWGFLVKWDPGPGGVAEPIAESGFLLGTKSVPARLHATAGGKNRTIRERINEYGNLLFWYCALINESTL